MPIITGGRSSLRASPFLFPVEGISGIDRTKGIPVNKGIKARALDNGQASAANRTDLAGAAGVRTCAVTAGYF